MKHKNQVALTPPMGWNSWDCYGPAVNEEQLLGNAAYMAEHLKEYGWEYVVCDIQWSEPMAGTEGWDYRPFSKLVLDEFGRQMPAENRFPSAAGGKGFGPIAQRIHDMGLKFGIHIMRGVPRLAVHTALPVKGTNISCDKIALPNSICKWNTDMYGVDYLRPGAQEYYNSIFRLYAQWGVDFVKVDDICNTNAYAEAPYSAEKEIEMIRRAIDACGRDMVLSLSPGPAVIEKAWHLRKNANMWRITDDFWDQWELLYNMFERCEVWQRQVSEGCWPDCDMLPIGRIRITTDGKGHNTRFTKDEQITMMTLWSMFRSPMIMGGEMRDYDEFTLSLVQNREVLRLLSHSHGAEQVLRDQEKIVWKSEDDAGGSYIALFNITEQELSVSVSLEELGLLGGTLRDLWQQKNLGTMDRAVTALIPGHGAKLYLLK